MVIKDVLVILLYLVSSVCENIKFFDEDCCPESGIRNGIEFQATLLNLTHKCDTFDDEYADTIERYQVPVSKRIRFEPDKKIPKIIVKIRLNNIGKIRSNKDFILYIDHVFNPTNRLYFKLLNPLIFKIMQDQVYLNYGLQFLQIVNAQAQEEIINKRLHSFTGCDTLSTHPTCGTAYADRHKIPYSEGFCCSCDPTVNKEREVALIEEGILNNHCKTKGGASGLVRNSNVGEQTGPSYLDVAPHLARSNRSKRQATEMGYQIRGGQSCIERYTPVYADPKTYHESAHCLRFSKLWYNVYQLKNPFIEHQVRVQLYRKQYTECGEKYWVELTNTSHSKLGTNSKYFTAQKYGLLFSYQSINEVKRTYCLKTNANLMIPRRGKFVDKLPLIKGGAKEYLLVDNDLFNFNGDECDKVGVSYLAFVKQPNRCSMPRGTCLKNQPFDMWYHDKECQKNSKRGKYYLQYFASVPNESFPTSGPFDEELSLDYHGLHMSTLAVGVENEIDNLILNGDHGQLVEIITDASYKLVTIVYINVLNDGVGTSNFRLSIDECPKYLPKNWLKNISPPMTIPPHRSQKMILTLYGVLPTEKFYCWVKLLNPEGVVVSKRRMLLQKNDKCFCSWDCQCTCAGSVEGFVCKTLPTPEYTMAGFQGDVPFRKRRKRAHTKRMKNRQTVLIDNPVYSYLMDLVLLLFMMGVWKATIECALYCLGGGKSYWVNVLKLCLNIGMYVMISDYRGRRVKEFFWNCLYFILLPIATVFATKNKFSKCKKLFPPKIEPDCEDSLCDKGEQVYNLATNVNPLDNNLCQQGVKKNVCHCQHQEEPPKCQHPNVQHHHWNQMENIYPVMNQEVFTALTPNEFDPKGVKRGKNKKDVKISRKGDHAKTIKRPFLDDESVPNYIRRLRKWAQAREKDDSNYK